MNMEELRSFIVLAGHLHFGQAAQARHVSQPALTKQIRRLEEALGGKLFERGKAGTNLTAFGGRFLPRAKELVGAYDHLLADARKEAQGRGGRVRIGFGSYTLELVPRLIVKLRKVEPDIEITLRDMSTAEQIADLQSGRLDVGFTRLPLPLSLRHFAMRPVLSGHLALVLPAQELRPPVKTLDDCHDQPFVMLSKERSPGMYDLIMKLCARHGFHPQIVQEVMELTTALALVRAGMGLAIIPESSWSRRFGGVRIQAIPERAAAWAVGAVWRHQDTNPALRRFLDVLRADVSAAPRGGSEPNSGG
jgi:DNA-binding transcriptional LysR family regulator